MTQKDKLKVQMGHHGTSLPTILPIAVLQRIRAGDREALAAFLTTNASCIRRRLRGKLSGRVRRLLDTDDLFATTARRLDEFLVEGGRIDATCLDQLMRLVLRTAENVIKDKAKPVSARQLMYAIDIEAHGPCSARCPSACSSDPSVQEVLATAGKTAADADLVRLRLRGYSCADIGRIKGSTAAAVRQRLCRLRARLTR